MIVLKVERFIVRSFQEKPIHLIFTFFLMGYIFFYVHKKRRHILRNRHLSISQEEQIIHDWKPNPIVPENSNLPIKSPYTLLNGPTTTLNILLSINQNEISDHCKMKYFKKFQTDQSNFLIKATNFGIPNFHGLNMNEEIIQSCINSIKYDRQDLLNSVTEFEKSLCEWLNVEDSVIYCCPFEMNLSVIQTIVKNSDIVFLDEFCHFPLHFAFTLTNCKIVTFLHHSFDDLECKIRIHQESYNLWSRSNRWICVESIYENDGTVLNIPALIEIKNKYKMRLIVDETLSFGVLGQTGKGICEHFNIKRKDDKLKQSNVGYSSLIRERFINKMHFFHFSKNNIYSEWNIDVTCGSFSSAFGSLCSFVICTKELCDYQRLSSQSSPGIFNIISAAKSIEIFRKNDQSNVEKLRNNIKLARTILRMNDDPQKSVYHKLAKLQKVKKCGDFGELAINNLYKMTGSELSPIIHLGLLNPKTIEIEDKIFQEICHICLVDENYPVAISKTNFVRNKDLYAPRSSIKIFISAAHTEEQITQGMKVIRKAAILALKNS